MCDVLVIKRMFWMLNLIDDFNREAIAVEEAFTMPAMRKTQILERTIHEQGKSSCIRVDKNFKSSSDHIEILASFSL